MKSKKSLLANPEGRQRVHGIRKKYKRKPRVTDGWVTIRGARCFIEGGVITKGPKGLLGRKSLDEEVEEYQGLRSPPRSYTMKTLESNGVFAVQVWDGEKLLHMTPKHITKDAAQTAANWWLVHAGRT